MGLLEPTIGEALDRLSILDLKVKAATLANISTDNFTTEQAQLRIYLAGRVPELNGNQDRFDKLRQELARINAYLWMREDEVRTLRREAEWDTDRKQRFAHITLDISVSNDQRAQLVRDLNLLCGLDVQEKIYAPSPTPAPVTVLDSPQRFRPFPSARERIHPGEALLLHERYEEALPYLEQQLEEEWEKGDSPHLHMILSNLGICYRIMGRYQDSNNAHARAIMLQPSNAVLWSNSADTMFSMGEYVAGMKAVTNAYRLDPSNRDVAFCYTLALLREGRWTEAWPIWERSRPHYALDLDKIVEPDANALKEWHGEDFPSGSRFLVIGEWGYGDAILQLRYLFFLKERGAHITYLGWGRLESLLHACPWIDDVQLYVKPGEEPNRLRLADYDYHVCIMDLPARFGSMPSSVPLSRGYLDVSRHIDDSNRLVGAKRKIGICWQAEESAYSHRFRSYRDTEIAPLESVDAIWYSLDPGRALPWMLPHSPASWLDSAVLISQLDLVITVDTAVAHLAGALGVPTYLMLAAGSAWQWLLDRPTSVWYDSMRLYRSEGPDDFLAIPERIARELR